MKEQVDYFLRSIFEAKSAFNVWKMIVYSRWEAYVGKELADKYVKIQKCHSSLFPLIENSLLFHWVLLILHCFDPRKDTYSIDKINKGYYAAFIKNEENNKVLKRLKDVRDSLFAHRAKIIKGREIGSVESLDLFFKNIEDLYNRIRHDFDQSSVLFKNADDMKYEVENLFMNIEKGEAVRKKNIKDECVWIQNPKRISNIL